MEPKEIVEKWVEVFNTGNAEKIAEFYSENAINHQVVEQPIEGEQAIQNMFANEFARAEMTCIVENILRMERVQSWNGKTH